MPHSPSSFHRHKEARSHSPLIFPHHPFPFCISTPPATTDPFKHTLTNPTPPYPLLSVSLFLAATHHNFFPQSLGNFRFVSLNFSFSIGFIWFFVGFVCASFFMVFSMTCFGIVFVSFLYFPLWWHRLDHYNCHWRTCIWLPWRFGALVMEVTVAITVKEFVKR